MYVRNLSPLFGVCAPPSDMYLFLKDTSFYNLIGFISSNTISFFIETKIVIYKIHYLTLTFGLILF